MPESVWVDMSRRVHTRRTGARLPDGIAVAVVAQAAIATGFDAASTILLTAGGYSDTYEELYTE